MTKIGISYILGIRQSFKLNGCHMHGFELCRRTLAVFILATISVLTSFAQAPLSEFVVYTRIMLRQHMAGYKEGSSWDDSHKYTNTVVFNGYKPGRFTGRGCFAFMMDMMEYASNYEYPVRFVYGSYNHLPEIHIGDGIRLNNNGHSVVVIGKSDDGHTVTVAEGNYNSSVHWGRTIDLANPNNGFTYLATFWPENLFAKGDVNHDGSVNVTDVGLLMDYILGHNPFNFFSDNANYNDDEGINISDVVAIVAHILGEIH